MRVGLLDPHLMDRFLVRSLRSRGDEVFLLGGQHSPTHQKELDHLRGTVRVSYPSVDTLGVPIWTYPRLYGNLTGHFLKEHRIEAILPVIETSWTWRNVEPWVPSGMEFLPTPLERIENWKTQQDGILTRVVQTEGGDPVDLIGIMSGGDLRQAVLCGPLGAVQGSEGLQGHLWPSPHQNRLYDLSRAAERASRRVGVLAGPILVRFLIQEGVPFIQEFTPGFSRPHLELLAFACEFPEAYPGAGLIGLRGDHPVLEPRHPTVFVWFPPLTGTIRDVQVPDWTKQIRTSPILVGNGDRLDPDTRWGWVCARGSTLDEPFMAVRKFLDRLQVHLE